MRIALLGMDDEAWLLATEWLAQGHALVVACMTPDEWRGRVGSLAPVAEMAESWEPLCDARSFDFVLVAANATDDARIESLRKLMQLAVPVVLMHPAVDSMVAAFELAMILDDCRGIVVPGMLHRWAPATSAIAALMDDGGSAIGRCEQIVFERAMSDRSNAAVLRQLAGDVDRLRQWCGELTKVTAMVLPAEPFDFGHLGVQLSGNRGVVARWSVQPGDAHSAQVTLYGASGRAVLEEFGDYRTATLQVHTGNATHDVSLPTVSVSALLVEHVAKRLAGEELTPTWLDAARAIEIVDAVQRSARRGRTIELYLEEVNEESTFKGVMAAGGCLLLMLTVVVLIAATTAVHLQFPLAEAWPYAIFSLLGIFLLLQLFKLAFPPRKDRKGSADKP